jgi:hypothetical protein
MSNIAPVSGVGKKAKRIDRGMAQRVARDAKIENATGGNYGARKDITETAQGAPTAVSTVPVAQPQQVRASLPEVDVFAPGSGMNGTPLSQGAPGGPGAGSEVLSSPVASIDNGSALARALLLANPESRQLRDIVLAFNEEGK